MPSRTNFLLLALLCAGLLPGCVDQAFVGTSGRLDVDLPQSTLGAFAYDSSAAMGDVNGDGIVDLIVWTNASRQSEGVVGNLPIPPVGVFVYFGGAGRFETQLGPVDADLTYAIPEAYFVGRVRAQDLDGDGAAELIVHVAGEPSQHFWPMPVEPRSVYPWYEAGIYVVEGGSHAAGVHDLSAVGRYTSAYLDAVEYMVHAPYALRDLDGTPGEEFLTEPYRLTDVGNTTINVRNLETGEMRARLLAPADTYLDVRGVLDHDGDGADDVVVLYVHTNGRNPSRENSWRQVGIGVFYGPLEGDLTLGDEGTMQTILVAAGIPSGRGPYVLGGAARTLIGDYCGDATEDVLLAVEGQLGMHCVPGGSREADGTYVSHALGSLTLPLANLEWTFAVTPAGEARSRLFIMGSNLFAFLVPELRTLGPDGVFLSEEEVVNQVGLSYDMPQDSPLFTSLGGAMGDLDGDGVLDVALGTRARELERESFVHIIYGFGG